MFQLTDILQNATVTRYMVVGCAICLIENAQKLFKLLWYLKKSRIFAE